MKFANRVGREWQPSRDCVIKEDAEGVNVGTRTGGGSRKAPQEP